MYYDYGLFNIHVFIKKLSILLSHWRFINIKIFKISNHLHICDIKFMNVNYLKVCNPGVLQFRISQVF